MINLSAKLRLENQHTTLPYLIDGIMEQLIYKEIVPGKWSIFLNMAHLGRYQEIFADRIQQILEKDQPIFDRYRAEMDPLFDSWKTGTIEKTLDKLVHSRAKMIKQIEELKEAQWSRIGIHPKLGKMDLKTWIEFFLLHEAHHLYTIFWMRQELIRETDIESEKY